MFWLASQGFATYIVVLLYVELILKGSDNMNHIKINILASLISNILENTIINALQTKAF